MPRACRELALTTPTPWPSLGPSGPALPACLLSHMVVGCMWGPQLPRLEIAFPSSASLASTNGCCVWKNLTHDTTCLGRYSRRVWGLDRAQVLTFAS